MEAGAAKDPQPDPRRSEIPTDKKEMRHLALLSDYLDGELGPPEDPDPAVIERLQQRIDQESD